MPRYSNDGWANLLAAVDYRNAEPERQANNQIRMMQLQALKDAHQKRTALEAYRTGLDAPVTPETTQTVPDPVASAQTDPNALYQEQPTKEVTVPPVYLNEIQKLEKMERYMAMQGNYQEAKQLNEYIKQTKEMGQHNPIVWQAWEASGGNVEITKKMLMAHGASQEQVDDIDFSMAGMGALGSKRAGMYMTREGKTIHNKPKEATPKSPKQVIVNDEIKYVDDNGDFVEGLGGPRYKPTIPKDESNKQEKAQVKKVKDAVAKLRAWQVKNYKQPNADSRTPPSTREANEKESMKVEMLIAQLESGEVNPDEIRWPTELKDGRLVHKTQAQPTKQAAGKKLVGTKDGKPVYDIGNGNWQVGD